MELNFRRFYLFFIALLCSVILNSQTIIRVEPNGNNTSNGDTWANATTIQHAINLANNNTQIWLREGTYNISSTLIINNSNISLYGGFNGTETLLNQRDFENNLTILDGQNSVKIMRFGSNDGILDGIHFRNGYVTGTVSTTNDGGGALRLAGNDQIVRNCTFFNNRSTAERAGGAIFIWHGGGQLIENCVFDSNSHFISSTNSNGGGAIHNWDEDVTIKNCVFGNNESSHSGGAIYSWGNNFVVENSTFQDNYSRANGGAIHLNSNDLHLRNSTFRNNTSETEGGAISNRGTLNVDESIFDNNHAKTNGGAIYNPELMTINFSNFLNNHADEDGGAIYNQRFSEKSYLTQTIFTQNTAKKGGAIYNDSDEGLYIINSLFHLNNALEMGGAILNDKKIFITNNTFVENKNTAIVYNHLTTSQNFPYSTNIYNSIFYLNSAKENFRSDLNSKEIGQDASDKDIRRNIVEEYDLGTNNMIGINPQFIDNTSNFRLQTTSPAINAGNNSLYNQVSKTNAASSQDLDKNPRLFGETIDYGAYELQEIATPTEPNCATITFPTNNQDNVSLTPEITWNSVPNVDGYRISIGTSPTNFDVLDNFDVGDVTNYNVTTTLDKNTTYYILVVPYNSVGEAQNCTTISFTTLQNTNPCDEDLIINLEITGNDVKVLLDNGNPPYLYSLNGENHQESNQFFNLPNGNHTLEIITSDGCKKEIQFEILEIHNAITPNGDGINDVLNFSFLMNKENAKLNIFDRYGNTIFIGSRENNFIWNGQLNKNEITTDSYWYLIEWQENKNNSIIKISNWILVKNK